MVTENKKKCSSCIRFEERDVRPEEKGTYHCCRQSYVIDKFPDDDACEQYWDRAEYEREEAERKAETERKRQEMWAIYADKLPVKLPILFDGFGYIPMCPICGEPPYSYTQCHWCGQQFIQDEDVLEYSKPDVAERKCYHCGGTIIGTRSKYNGHFHGSCPECGAIIVE